MMPTPKEILLEIKAKHPYIDSRGLRNAKPKEIERMSRLIPEIREYHNARRSTEQARKARNKRVLHYAGGFSRPDFGDDQENED